jgi:sporulation protein YlmC with PRC-barrel domain
MNLTVASEFFETGPSESIDYEPAFKGCPMWTQFGKIEDSQTLEGVIKPKKLRKVTTVVTDDNQKFTLTAREVKTLKEIILAFPTQVRSEVFREIQSAKGLTSVIKWSKIDKVTDDILIKIWEEMNE